MVRKVKLPNGKIGNFPDDMTNADIEAVLQKQFPPDEETPSISSDITGSIAGVPAAFLSAISNLPGEAISSGEQISENPLRAVGNLGAGLLEGLKGGANIPSNIASYLGSRNIGRGNIEDFIKALHIPDTGLEKRIFGENQAGDELIRSLGSFAPYARLGGLAKGLGGTARRAGAAGAYATGQEQDPLKAALLSLGAEGVTKGVQRVGRPERFLPSSPLSADELREAANITRGTETGLGSVIENPFFQRQFENVLPNLPLSGATQAMQRTAADVTERGENILNKLKGENETPDIGSALRDALKSAESETRLTKEAKFKVLNEAAEKEGITTNRATMRQEAKDALADIKKDPDLALLTDKKTQELLKNLAKQKGKSSYSLKETDFLRGELGERAHDAYMANDTKLSKIFGSLKKAAEKDINHAIDNSNSPQLDKLRDEAMKFYKEHYVAFEEPEIRKFTRKGGDPDTLISTFLKRSRISDRGKLLEKLTSKLTNEDRQLLAYSYFSKAIEGGQLNPLKFKTLYKSLGENQKKALLGSDEAVKQLSDYTTLIQKNTDPLNIMFNPKTGQRGLSEFPWKSLAVGGSAGGFFTGGIPGAIIGALLPGIAARPLVKGLTSPTMREKLIERMIASREKEPLPQRNIAPLIQALMQVSQTKT